MSFSSPLWLFALLLIPAALQAQRLSRRRAKRYALRFPALTTLQEAIGRGPDWRRHLPVAALLLSVAALAVALARPHVTKTVAIRQASLVLVLDHSGSMAANDVSPTRLAAAEQAANTFVDQLPSTVKVGVVGFSNSPDVILAPTANHAAAHNAIDSQNANGGTATGTALNVALGMLNQSGKKGRAAIVLLSDGAANEGEDPVTVATQAARDKVSIDTVALGTPNGTLANPDPLGPPVPVPPDPQLMQQIASASHGKSFNAQDAGTLSSIYKGLGTELGTRKTTQDLTAAFAAAGMVMLLLAGLGSLRWSGRLP
jgi:Ca-activated chloride channel family protein